METYDIVVVGGTPGGIMAAIAAARRGHTVLLLERNKHIGGLPANGLGASDIGTRGCAGGLAKEFFDRVLKAYVDDYGAESQQVKDCSGGFHFEPHVAEGVLEAMLAEQPKITVKKMQQFDALERNVMLDDGAVTAVLATDRETEEVEWYRAKVFIDGTYEGDLAAAAGAPFRTRREGHEEYNEPLAGRVYKKWSTAPTELGEGSTLEGDDTIQAYNYRLCLSSDPANSVPIPKPETYHRDEYASIVDDVKLERWTGSHGSIPWGLDRVTNIVKVPNNKTDANNQHHAFVSTDLPEENYPWPTADWAWRDQFAQRLRDYTLGLLWFAQNDPELPEDFRQAALKWGLAADEYQDNGHFPRQVYVREGRRVEGEWLFTAHDAIPVSPEGRPPVHRDSITASHYAIDSHAHRKREPDRVHLDGFLSHPTRPYTVPYGVILPKTVDQVLTPVPVSGTHLGFGTLRMEPCWMAMGHAAGVAASLSITSGRTVRKIDVAALQDRLLDDGAVLLYYQDINPGDELYEAVQKLGLQGKLSGWKADLDGELELAEAREFGVDKGTVRREAVKKAAG